ncbi:MAG: thiol-disulfide isomerase/thioredoxin, partial [Neolewinella sp.]
MSLRKLLFLTFLFSLSLSSFAQGIEFFHGTWEEALVKSETEGKLIFVDAYTTWCGPCKKMSANVFPAAEVGEVFNANFINVKLDMEKAESVSFRRVHSVRAYPTLFWINGKDEVVHTSVGGKQVASLITVANAAIAKQDDIETLAAEWEAGDRDPKLAFTYIRALVRREE